MKERIARAICYSTRTCANRCKDKCEAELIALKYGGQLKQAQSVLDAIVDPTDNMLYAGNCVILTPISIWQAMIKEANKDE